MLEGYRTKIWAALASLPTTLNTLIGQMDPELVTQIVTDYPVVLLMYQLVTLLGTYYFYDQKADRGLLDA
jgi:hypothetical protein